MMNRPILTQMNRFVRRRRRRRRLRRRWRRSRRTSLASPTQKSRSRRTVG